MMITENCELFFDDLSYLILRIQGIFIAYKTRKKRLKMLEIFARSQIRFNPPARGGSCGVPRNTNVDFYDLYPSNG